MRYTTRWMLVLAGTLAACSSDPGGQNTGVGELGVVNAATSSIGGQLKLDGTAMSLPGIGQASSTEVNAGSHTITLTSAAGATLATTSFTVPDGGRRTAVFTGSNSASVTLSITSDTMTTNGNGGYHSIVGSMLLVNSVSGQGPFGLRVSQTGSDSIVRFGGFGFGAGSLPPPAPYGFYVPFPPGTYRIDLTSGFASDVSLATTTLTLATNDRWIVTLMSTIEGELVLQAVKQP